MKNGKVLYLYHPPEFDNIDYPILIMNKNQYENFKWQNIRTLILEYEN